MIDNPQMIASKIAHVRQLVRSRKLDEAIVGLEEIIEVHPDVKQLHRLLCNLRAQRERFDIPVPQLIKAIKVKPDLEASLQEIGKRLLETGKVDEAYTIVSKLVEAVPESYLNWINLATVLTHLKRFDEAENCLKTAVVLNKNSYQIHIRLGNFYITTGKYKLAGRSFRNALELNPCAQEAYEKLKDLHSKGILFSDDSRFVEEMTTTKKTSPALSVNLLVYNEIDFIDLWLENTVPFVDEVVILDGGSTDGTLEHIKNYNSDKIKLYIWKQEGTHFSREWQEPARRNLMIIQSTGDWILKKDVDEFFLEEDYKKIRDIMEQGENYLYCFPRYNFWGNINRQRLNTPDDPHWYPDPQGNLWKRTLGLRYSDDPLHSYPERNGARYTSTKFIGTIHIYHYHWALGKKIKINDLRKGDFVDPENWARIPPLDEDRYIDPALVKWDCSRARCQDFWGKIPQVIQKHFGIDTESLDKKSIEELKEYFGRPEEEIREKYYSSVEYLDREWKKAKRETEEEIVDFYKMTDGYVYNLAHWHNMEYRKEWSRNIGKICQKYGVRTILDYGCGIAGDSIELAKRGFQVTAMDLPGQTLEFARWRVKKYNLPIDIKACEPYGITSEKYDAVMCLDVIAHVKNPIDFLKQLMENVNPGGLFIVSNDCTDEEDNQPMHLRENIALHDTIFEVFKNGQWELVSSFHPVNIYRKLGVLENDIKVTTSLVEKKSDVSERSAPPPQVAQIEITNFCTARCVYCPHPKMKREKEHMPLEKFKLIVDKVCDFGVQSILPFLNGEALVHPDIVEAVKYIKRKQKFCRIFTNMSLMTPDMAKKLLDSGLDYITMSIDSLDKKTFEGLKVGARFEKVLDNVKELIRIRDEGNYTTIIDVVMVYTNDPERRDMEARFWKDHGNIHYSYFVPFNWAGEVKREKNVVLENRKPCVRLFRDLTILVDGRICLCCLDYEGRVTLGDVYSDDLEKIWNGPILRKMRQEQKQGVFKGLCRLCDAEFYS